MSSYQILVGDVREQLAQIPDESVQTCVTSPPYWGLRDYGTASWDGGDPECEHAPPQDWIDHNFNANSGFGVGAGTQSAASVGRWYSSDGACRCGAVRIDSQIGLEQTPEEYVEQMVQVFREVRRVLRDDGTLWLNLGDSYAINPGDRNKVGGFQAKPTADRAAAESAMSHLKRGNGLKPKDLVGIPWRVAFALQADGWWLRSDIIWHKPNPMPESIRDRPTKSHEHIFLLTKSARYFYDIESVREQPKPWNDGKMAAPKLGDHKLTDAYGQQTVKQFDEIKGANRRDVWTITTKPFPGAHFAVFPPEVPTLCIKAGTKVGDTVLDPFTGSGTTGIIASNLGRDFVGIELNPEYAEMARTRIHDAELSLFGADL